MARLLPAARAVELDRLRGLAVGLMVADHLLIVSGHAYSPLRYTLTRAAMPLFMVLAGHLFRRLSWRHVLVLGVGLVVPVLAPWIDRPNILVWYVLGCAVLAGIGWAGSRPVAIARSGGAQRGSAGSGDESPAGAGGARVLLLFAVVVFALARAANGYGFVPGSFDPFAVVALMAAGALVPRTVLLGLGSRLPARLAVVGRFPLSVYVGHLVLLRVVVSGG